MLKKSPYYWKVFAYTEPIERKGNPSTLFGGGASHVSSVILLFRVKEKNEI